jgi:hypothetical protein
MPIDLTKLAPFLKLWFLTALTSVCMLSLGMTGGIPFADVKIIGEAKEVPAQITGWILMAISLTLLYKPPREYSQRKSTRNRHSISPTQLALFTHIDDWTNFGEAHHVAKPATMPLTEFNVRVQLAILQGVLMHQIVDGKHKVKYRVNLNDNE